MWHMNVTLEKKIKRIHKSIQQRTLSVLPRYINHVRGDNEAFHAVITGGLAALECAMQGSKQSKDLASIIFSQDIDIHIIFPKGEPDIEDLLIASEKREKFLKAIVNDKDLLEYCTRVSAENKIQCNLAIDYRMLNLPKEHEAYHAQVIRIRINYVNNAKELLSLVLLDISMYTPRSKPIYNTYKKFFGNTPVPYVVINNLPYATCNYVMYDTIRMIAYYRAQLADARPNDRVRNNFNVLKLANLILKLIALEDTIMHKVKEDALLLASYNEVKSIVTHIDYKSFHANEETIEMLMRTLHLMKEKSRLQSYKMGKVRMIDMYQKK